MAKGFNYSQQAISNPSSMRCRTAVILVVALATAHSSLTIAPAQEVTAIPFGSTWSFRKGTNEVSDPRSAWRQRTFDDSTWPVSAAPFHYGEGLFTGTALTDMRGNYTCIFLRHTFFVTNVAGIASLQLEATFDDGMVAWINGTEVARALVNPVSPFYTSTASQAHEALPAQTFIISSAPENYLVEGVNVLTVQAFNSSISSSSDFRFDGELKITWPPPPAPPVIESVSPLAGTTVSALTQVTVTFSEAVTGVDAGDVLINETPANSVTVLDTDTYVFSFAQPEPGPVLLTWAGPHQITDSAGELFDADAPGATWSYTLLDTVAPVVSVTAPPAGAQVSQLQQVEVTFSEPVQGVNAQDLLVNGQPATSVSGADMGPYVFTFAPQAPGLIQFSWNPGHGITDLAPAPNDFVGGPWSLTLNSGAAEADVVISEFVAGNLSGLRDENNEAQDWIEIWNRGSNAVNLLGWSLTDDADVPGKWTFPSRVLNPGEYLVVFASEKDRTSPSPGNRFHTNFKLNLFGEYLALLTPDSPRIVASEFPDDYPEQRNNHSFGIDPSGAWRYYTTPTPGAPNGNSAIVAVAPEPHFSVERGFFDAPFHVLLTSPVQGATIRFTTDGSEPTSVNGSVYSQPILITNTTVLRAAVFAPNHLSSRTATHSYFFLDTVLAQPNNPPGFPSTWGTFQSFPDNIVPADYEMDLDPLRVNPNDPASPVDPEKLQRFNDGMRELPVVSIVMDMDDMFNPSGLYHTPHISNKNFPDKPCSIEMILPDGDTAFAVVAGLSAHGNASREPRKNPKHGFKVTFKGDFGESTLEYPLFPDSPATEFDDLILRADFGSSWRHQSDTASEGLGAFQRSRATRTRDAFWKDTFRDMGQIASHSRYCHLFINGLYWGTYDFTEQPTETFAASYFGGEKEDFDIYEQGTRRAGTSAAYTAMTSVDGLSQNANYELMKQYLDVTQFIDYMLLHFFTGAQDWGYDPNKNWYAIRKRDTEGRFRYIPWDGENLLLNLDVNQVTASAPPSGLHPKLDDNAQYRLDFADRVHKHMVAPDGVLRPEANIARWKKWLAILDKPIVAESSRWGDYRRDVHNWPGFTSGAYVLYTRENQWLAESNRIVTEYLPQRTALVMNQLRSAGLYPDVAAPEFRENSTAGTVLGSRAVPGGFVLAMKNPGISGTIYFTTNGVDPRVIYSGAVSGSAIAYSNPIELDSTVLVKARVLNGNVWSALNEATFTVDEPGIPLRIVEIHYNPPGGDAYEFLELQNVGAVPIDLSRFSLSGVTFTFPDGSQLAPGALLVLSSAANPAAFTARYPSVPVFGRFSASLANGGERIAVLDRNGRTVTAVHYDDEDGWPVSADGGGYSLQIIDVRGDPNAPSNWRASAVTHGTPGVPNPVLPNPIVRINEVMADNQSAVSNNGAYPDWIELHNTGESAVDLEGWSLSDDSDPRRFVFPPGIVIEAGGYLVVWCDTAVGAPGLHAGFALGRTGETVSLHDSNTNRVDAVTFGVQLADYSLGRVGERWTLTLPTPTSENVAAAVAGHAHLRINEWLADPVPGADDWLELFNTSSDAPVALEGVTFSTSTALFHCRALSFIAPLGYLQLFAAELAGPDQLDFRLPGSGGSIALLDQTGGSIDEVVYGTQIEGVSQGRYPDGTDSIVSFAGTVSPNAPNFISSYTGPILNEVLARNHRSALTGCVGCSDFIELFNPGPATADLGGMALGRSVNDPSRWTFPMGTLIGPGEYIVIACDDSRPPSSVAGANLNTGFALPDAGGEVCLFSAAGQVVDSVAFGFQVPDRSIGRVLGGWLLLETPTPGLPNSAPATLGPVSALRINEWIAAPLSGPDWFELYNTSPLPVHLGGVYLADDPSVAGRTQYQVAPLTFIGGLNWVVWQANNNVSKSASNTGFALDQLGETLRIYDSNLTLIDAVDFGLQTPGISEGRVPDGAGVSTALSEPSPGFSNNPAQGGIGLMSPRIDGSGQFTMELSGPPNQLYVIEVSSDLVTWEVVGTVYPTDGAITVTPPFDFDASRFYRARRAN